MIGRLMAVALVTGMPVGEAAAMGKATSTNVVCTVRGGDKLAGAGGTAGICAAFEKAAKAKGQKFGVRVTVAGPSALTAEVTTAKGKVLPPLRLDSADRPISAGSVDRFAATLVEQVAKAAGHQH